MLQFVRSVLSSLVGHRRPTTNIRASRFSRVPTLEFLEDRFVPSTVSSITANFNGTAIPANSTLWFNSSFQASGLPKTGAVTIHVEHGSIDGTLNGSPYHVAVPNAEIVLTNGATSASTTFDPTDNDWDVSAPTSGAGDIFMTGVALPVSGGLPKNIQNITWSADFWSDTANVTVSWKWAASVYTSFSTNYNALNVKPVDNKDLSAYKNGDQSGAPEAFKSSVVAGGTGGGGTNYTGNYTASKSVKPALGDGLQDYPYPSSNPLTNIAFNESAVLRAANLDAANGYFQVWYSDEHALALGVGQVNVKRASGTTTTNYSIAPLTSNPGVAMDPAVGTTATTGDQAGTDISGRPMAPSLFITDTTTDPNCRSGDWQCGGTAISPDAVFGTWKSFSKTVDYTSGTPTVSVNTGVDPAKNNWNLGSGSDAAPAGLTNEGYGSEIRWNLDDLYVQGILQTGHSYRFYVIVHDGDQNKVGGDAGQASFNYLYPGPANITPSPAGGTSLSGRVFNDANLNGSLDSGEFGLTGWIVALNGTDYLGNTVSLTVTTASDGSYTFSNLQAGTYSVSIPNPFSGFASTGSTAGTVGGITDGSVQADGSVSTITLNAGDQGVNYNFAEFSFA